MPEGKANFGEVGTTGLKISRGIVQEEFLRQLQGEKGVKVYTEMSHNDAIVGSALWALEMLLRRVDWEVAGENEEEVEFVKGLMQDMSHSWADFIGEALSMLTYGWAYFEMVYKTRGGPNEKDTKKRSKYNDGKIGWRKFAPRGQETLKRWEMDEEGGVAGLVQQDPDSFGEVLVPIEKSLLFRVGIRKNNPEGRSALRTAYRAWWLKKRIEELEGIGIERDLAGIPVIRVPGQYLDPTAPSEVRSGLQKFEDMGKNLRNDEQAYVMLPSDRYNDGQGEFMFDLELLSTGGTRTYDTSAIIERYSRQIAMTVLADVIMLGHESVGSFNLSVTKDQMLTAGLQALLNEIANVLNTHALPRVYELNGMEHTEESARFAPGRVERVDSEQLSQAVLRLAQAGMPLFPDPELESHFRQTFGWPQRDPALDEELERQREEELAAQAGAGGTRPGIPEPRTPGGGRDAADTAAA